MEKSEYVERLQLAVEHLHGCRAEHSAAVPVHEVFRGETVWQGDVEVFDLNGHAKGKLCSACSHADGQDDADERFVAVLEIPPVDSAVTAVRMQIVKDSKNGRKNV